MGQVLRAKYQVDVTREYRVAAEDFIFDRTSMKRQPIEKSIAKVASAGELWEKGIK